MRTRGRVVQRNDARHVLPEQGRCLQSAQPALHPPVLVRRRTASAATLVPAGDDRRPDVDAHARRGLVRRRTLRPAPQPQLDARRIVDQRHMARYGHGHRPDHRVPHGPRTARLPVAGPHGEGQGRPHQPAQRTDRLFLPARTGLLRGIPDLHRPDEARRGTQQGRKSLRPHGEPAQTRPREPLSQGGRIGGVERHQPRSRRDTAGPALFQRRVVHR